MDVEVIQLTPQIAATLRITTDPRLLSSEVEARLTDVWAWLEAHGREPAGPPFSLLHHLTLDGDVPAPGEWTVEAGWPIDSPLVASDDVRVHELPGGEAASVLHLGDHTGLVNAYLLLQSWLLANQRQPEGSPWEIYLTDPAQEPDPDQWQTQVVWPLEPGDG